MRLVVVCKNCKSTQSINRRASDRYKLSQKVGEEFDHRCSKCSAINKYNVDEVTAETGLSRLVFFIASLVGIGIGFVLLGDYFSISTWWLIPILISVPVSFFAVISKEENNKIRAFNRFKLNGR